MKQKIGSLILLFFITTYSFSQTVKITTVIQSIGSKKISDYANNATSNVIFDIGTYCCWDVNLAAVKITNNTTGATLESRPDGRIAFSFGGNPIYILNNSDLSQTLDPSVLVITGFNRQETGEFLANGTLPNGSYTFCYQFWGGRSTFPPIDQTDAGTFNCNTINIGNSGDVNSLYEMPIVLYPQCGIPQLETNPQNVIFSWMTPSSFNVQNLNLPQEYVLRIVEMNERTDPYDAMRNATVPFFFEKIIIGNSYIYGPADPKLEPKKNYAFIVTISIDRDNYRNHGQSDVCWFTYGNENGTDTLVKDNIKAKPKNQTVKQMIVLQRPLNGETAEIIMVPVKPRSINGVQISTKALKNKKEKAIRFAWKGPSYMTNKRYILFIAKTQYTKTDTVVKSENGKTKQVIETSVVKLSADQAFTSHLVDKISEGIEGTHFDFIDFYKIDPGINYYWKVIATGNGSELATETSENWTFKTPGVPKNPNLYKLNGQLVYQYKSGGATYPMANTQLRAQFAFMIKLKDKKSSNTGGGKPTNKGNVINQMAFDPKGKSPGGSYNPINGKVATKKDNSNESGDANDGFASFLSKGGWLDGTLIMILEIMKDTSHIDSMFYEAFNINQGTYVTDALGGFTVNTDVKLGFIKNMMIEGTEVEIHRGIRVFFDNPGQYMKYNTDNFYVNPDEFWVEKPAVSESPKKFISRVRSYRIKIKIKELEPQLAPGVPLAEATESILKGKTFDIYCLRKVKKNFDFMPDHEGDNLGGDPMLSAYGSDYHIISKQTCNMNSKVVFENIITANPSVMIDIAEAVYVYAVDKVTGKGLNHPLEFYAKDNDNCPGLSGSLFLGAMLGASKQVYDGYYDSTCRVKEWYIEPWNFNDIIVTGKIKYNWKNSNTNNQAENINFPLNNIKVSLLACRVMKETGTNNFTYITNYYTSTLVSTTTNEDGFFELPTNDAYYYPMLSESNKVLDGAYFDDGNGRQGDIYRTYRVVIESPYFTSPTDNVWANQGFKYNVGTLYSNVKEADLKGTASVLNFFLGKNDGGKTMLDGVQVLLCRRTNDIPEGLPKDEANINSVSLLNKTYSNGNTTKYTVLAQTKTNGNGEYEFKRLVDYDLTVGSNSRYYIVVSASKTGTDNFSTLWPEPASNKDENYSNDPKPFFNDGYPTKSTVGDVRHRSVREISCVPIDPVVQGNIYPETNLSTTALSGVVVKLYRVINKSKWNQLLALFKSEGLDDKQVSDRLTSKVSGWSSNKSGVEGTPSAELWLEVETQVTYTDGAFYFNKLQKNWASSDWGPYFVFCEKEGFNPKVEMVNGGMPLLNGQKGNLPNLQMKLPFTMIAKLVDESDSKIGVAANVVVGQNWSWGKSEMSQYSTGDEIFTKSLVKFQAPNFYNLKSFSIKVIPDNLEDYMETTVEIKPNGGDKWTFTDGKLIFNLADPILVKRKKHFIAILARDKITKTGASKVSITLEDANVAEFIGINIYYSKSTKTTTTPGPIGTSSFKSAGSNFNYTIKAEKTTGSKIMKFGIAKTTVNQDPDKTTSNVEVVDLNYGCIIKGKVTNQEGKPYMGARIFLDDALTNGIPLEAYTDNEGKYTLEYVPLVGSSINVYASITGQNALGEKKQISLGTYSSLTESPQFNLDFTLTKVTNMDINQLAGFNVQLTSMKLIAKGEYSIAGQVVDLKNNDVIRLKKGTNFHFHNAVVKAGSNKNTSSGLPEMIMIGDFVSMDDETIDVEYFEKTMGILYRSKSNKSGIRLKKDGENGYISAEFTELSIYSFAKGISLIGDWQSENTYLDLGMLSNKNFNYLNLISSSGLVSSNFKNGFSIADNNYGLTTNFHYMAHGIYDCEAKLDGCTFKNDILQLPTILHTSLENIPADQADQKIDLGLLSATWNQGLNSKSFTNKLKIKINAWSLESENWTFGNKGLNMNKGILNAGVALNFDNLTIYPNKPGLADYKLDQLSLAGVLDLKLNTGSNVAFGYDNGMGFWALSVTPPKDNPHCTQITGLEGLENQSLNIKTIKSYSNGEFYIDVDGFGSIVQLYNILEFRPATIDVSNGALGIKGQLNLKIPEVELVDNFKLLYIKDKNTGITKLSPTQELDIKFHTKGVKIHLDPSLGTSLTKGKMEANGYLIDEVDNWNTPESALKYKFKILLTKTSNNIDINIVGNENKFYFNPSNKKLGINLSSGTMNVSNVNSPNAKWNNFKFKGKTVGFDPKQIDNDKSTLGFEIKGDLVCNENNVGIKNIESPVGNISFVYDMNQKALIGNTFFDQSVGGNLVKAQLNVRFGAGGEWYLSGAGEMWIPSMPNAPIALNHYKAGFFLGNASASQIDASIPASFSMFTYDGSIPNEMKGDLKGIIMGGGIGMPVPIIPSFNLDLNPIVSTSLCHEIYANVILGIPLDGLKINFSGNVGIKIHAGVGASVGLACMTVGLDVNAAAVVQNSFIDLTDAASYAVSKVANTATNPLGAISQLMKNPVAGAGESYEILKRLKFHYEAGSGATLTGSATVGALACDSDCDGWFCVTKSASITVKFMPILYVDKSQIGGYETISFGLAPNWGAISINW